MTRNTTPICFVLIAMGWPAIGWLIAAPEGPRQPTEIPFVLSEDNNMIVNATINGTVVKLMYHTGVGGVSVTESATPGIADLEMSQGAAVESWGGKSTTRVASGNELGIGGLTWQEVTIFECKHSGPGTDGKFGSNVFGDRVIEIDFAKSRLVIHEGLPKLTSSFHRLPLEIDGDSVFVPGTIVFDKATYQQKFMIHSGFGGSLLLSRDFVVDNRLESKLTVISERTLTDSYGNLVTTKKVKLPQFALGSVNLKELPAEIFAGGNVVGGALLKRFHLILDRPGGNLYFRQLDGTGTARNRRTRP